MNLLNEKLSAVRRQKAILKKNMKKETDRKMLMKLANDIRQLNDEEMDLLNKLGVNI